LKALLLGCLRNGCTSIQAEHFYTRMIEALRYGGIEGKYHTLFTKAQLRDILHFEQPDIVYCADHHIPGDLGEQISPQEIFDEERIPYVGSSPKTINLALSKSHLKKMWRANDLPTPHFFLVQKTGSGILGLEEVEGVTDYPYVLKPNKEGNSRGLDVSSIVFDKNSLILKLEQLLPHYNEVLIEKFLGLASDIREFTVAMIGNGQSKLLLPAEIVLRIEKSVRIVTTKDKENHHTSASPVKDPALNRRLSALADQAFEIAGVYDYSRCDMIQAEGKIYAIEINGQPMIPDKWFEACASGVGLDSDQYLNAIFLASIVRNNYQGKSNLNIPVKMKQHLPKLILERILNP